jgi:hypothetical protein
MTNISQTRFADANRKLKSCARVALHFHPDRLDHENRSVAEALIQDGVYRSQFETQISSGSVSAFPGGERDEWERRIFGGAYQKADVTKDQRPKYGALDLMQHPDGPAPRFGSCYFLLSPECSARCTFTYMDSHQDPKEMGTIEEFDDVMAALLTGAFRDDYALGQRDLTPPVLIDHLCSDLTKPFPNPSRRTPGRNLNHYIEAQVHGDIRLADDVDLLVADPAFKDGPTGESLVRICSDYSINLLWHMGFVMPASDVPSDFRGPSMPSLAKRIARGGLIDAEAIGSAAMDLKLEPGAWSDRGSYREVLQELKLMWHVLLRYGQPQYSHPASM